MKPILHFILTLFFLVSGFCLQGQNEFSKWHFGAQAGLDFSTQPPTVLMNSALQTFEGVASICDASGSLLFYTDGMTIYNSAGVVMANGAGLLGDISSTQSAMIVKQPGTNTNYYVFTTDNEAFADGFHYSIVDMSLAAGMGSVTVKNSLLYTPTCEKQVAVRHCNGKDAWIITHDYGPFFGNRFLSYLLTATGLSQTPVISTIGEKPYDNGGFGITAVGQLKGSPNGRQLAMAVVKASEPAGLGDGGFQLFDFDTYTGVVSNSLVLLSNLGLAPNTGAYGVEFSPDGRKLYGSTASYDSTSTALYQWDLCAPSASAIIASQYSVDLNTFTTGSLQRAIDGKIYISQANSQSLSVIYNPNNNGAASTYIKDWLDLSPKSTFYGLPNFINTYSPTPLSAFTHSSSCQTFSFSLPPPAVSSTGCQQTPDLPNVQTACIWTFGDPASGTVNTSTLSNPVHAYASPGTYTVSLVVYSACRNEVIKQTIQVNAPFSVNVSGNFNVCEGDRNTYTVSGGAEYLWSSGSTNSTAVLSTSATTIYSVTATLNGCSVVQTFTVTANRCVGIKAESDTKAPRIFPNPAKNLFSIETEHLLDLLLLDINGKLVLRRQLESGKNEIDISQLPSGVYVLKENGTHSFWRARLVKLE